MSIALILMYSAVASGVLPLVAASYNYSRLDRVLKIMTAFCVVSVISDLASLIASHFIVVYNTNFIMHLFDMVAVVFFTMIYCYVFYKPFLKRVTLLLGGISLALMIINDLFIEGIKVYPSISNTVLCLLLVPLSLIYFYQLLTRQEFVHIEKQALFWINAGVLFYFSVNIFLFMLWNKISQADKPEYYMVQSVTNIIANLLYSVGLLCKPQKTT